MSQRRVMPVEILEGVQSPRRVRRRLGLVGAGLAATLLCGAASGCTTWNAESSLSATGGSSSRSADLTGPSYAWRPVTLPPGVSVRTLTTMGDHLLVGGLTSATPPAPLLLRVDAVGGMTTVPLAPTSGYAKEARWYSVVTDGTRIVAVGGANGGAHANVRWTTWAGTGSGVTELPQSFYAFGGWGAGDLVAAVMTTGGDALVGSWGGAQAGLDAAVWTSSGDVWTRQDPAGTALESTPTLLVGPRAATPDGSGMLIAGSTLHLEPGSVRQQATLWRSAGVDTGWRRIDLPDAGTHSEAVSASCGPTATGGTCLVAGQVDGSLSVWIVSGDDQPGADVATRVTGIPALTVDDEQAVPAPMLSGSHTLIVTPGGAGTAVVSRSAGSSGPSGRWSASAGPHGTPVAAAVVGDRLYVATEEQKGGPATLWATDLT